MVLKDRQVPQARMALKDRQDRQDLRLSGTAGRSPFPAHFVDGTDENDPELIDIVALVAIPATDAFDVLATFSTLHSGEIKLNYEVN